MGSESHDDLQAGREALPRTVARLEEGIARGEHRGAQMHVWRGGRVVADFGIGEARPGVPMTSEAITPWLSSGKPITAVAIARLWEAGALDIDDRVAKHVPEFAHGGKENVTIRQILTHTAGFANAETGWPRASWEETIAAVCAAALESPPGERAAYHPQSSWFILGEIVRRFAGRPFGEAVRADIFEPLGMTSSWCGMPAGSPSRELDRIGTLWQRSRQGLDATDWDVPPRLTAPSPGSNCRGPVRELAHFYRMLLRDGELDGVRLLQPETVRELVRPRRVGMYDETFRHVVDFGLGVLVDSKRHGAETIPYGFGRHASSRTFGHGGAQSSIGFCDPERELVVVWVANGLIGEPRHQRRNREINEAVYEDVGSEPPA
ncbi:MAG: serine hydrolase domain-containing protein [Planctomycetaceae bacterium]